MSSQPSSQVSGRKICVPRRRCTRDKSDAQAQQAQNAGPVSFNFTPIGTTNDKMTPDKSTKITPSPSQGPSRPEQVPSCPTIKDKDDDSESKPDTFADAAAAASAFSKMSLHEKTSRTLYEAVRLNDMEMLRDLLKDKASVADQLNYALTMAVTKKSVSLAEVLLEHGADPKYLDHCYPLLMTATDLNDIPTVSLLLRFGADPNAGGMHGTALHAAMRFGSVDLARQLIAAGAKLERPTVLGGAYGLSLLALAVQANNRDCVELLLEQIPEHEMVDDHGRTPLHLAAQHGKMEIIQRLKGHGASALRPDHEGFLPWMTAVRNKHKKEADVLFPDQSELEAQIGAKEKRPLHFACMTGMTRCAERLLREGADINAQDADGMTPLMEAVRCRHQDVAVALVKAGKLKVDLVDQAGSTALFMALRHLQAMPTLPDLLVGIGADINIRLPYGRTVLMDYAQFADIVTWLLERGIDPTIRSERDETALANAVLMHSIESVHLLLRANVPLASIVQPGPQVSSPLEMAVLVNSGIMKLLFHAGCGIPGLSRWLRSASCEPVRDMFPSRVAWLERRARSPALLQEIARHCVLSQLGHRHLSQKVASLPISFKLKELLALDTFIPWKIKSYAFADEDEDEEEVEEEEGDEDEDYYEDDTEDSEDYENEDYENEDSET